jgi:hypothetical protein
MGVIQAIVWDSKMKLQLDMRDYCCFPPVTFFTRDWQSLVQSLDTFLLLIFFDHLVCGRFDALTQPQSVGEI